MEENKVVITNAMRTKDMRDRTRRSGIFIMLLKNRIHTHAHIVSKEPQYVIQHQATFPGHLLCGRTWARNSESQLPLCQLQVKKADDLMKIRETG